MVCIIALVRRIQIHIDEALDDAAEAEAARRGLSKAALIRASLARELAGETRPDADPWQAITGWLDDGPVKDLDALIYEQDR
jgi:ribbon-helix-helix CopG family protein